MDKVQYAIEIVDKWGPPMKRFKSEVAAVDKFRVKDPFKDMPRSIDQLRANLNRYKTAAEGTFRSDHLRKYNILIGETEKKIRMLESASHGASEKTSRLGGAMKLIPAIGIAGAITAAGTAIFRFGKDSIMAAAAFEKYGVTLRTMLGSQGAARERMAEYADIAKRTPFELQQVVEAGNQLQAIGRYSRGNVTMLGDLAAASGKPIEQVMNAYAKLSTGQKGEAVNQFRDLLIGDKEWEKALGKSLSKSTTEEMINILPTIMKTKGFFGMMDQQSRTTEGRISNLKDSFFMLKEGMGEKMKPAFDNFLVGTSGIVESMNKWVAVPVPQKIAREKAELNALVGVITDANTKQEIRTDLLRNLQQQYPEFLKGIDLETVKNEDLRKKLEEVNGQYETKIRLASMKELYEGAAGKVSEAEKNLGDAQLALHAQQEMEKGKSDIISILNAKGYNINGKVGEASLAQSVKDAMYAVYKDGNQRNFSGDDIDKLEYWKANYEAYSRLDSNFSTPEEAVKRYSAELRAAQKTANVFGDQQKKADRDDIYNRAKSLDINDKTTFDQLFGKKDVAASFDELRKKTSDVLKDEEWDLLKKYVNGELKAGSPGAGTPNPDGTNLDISRASATIDGGGKNVKQINVTIENLIGSNTNMFRDTDTMQGGEDFLSKLSEALQEVVNDVNYAAQ